MAALLKVKTKKISFYMYTSSTNDYNNNNNNNNNNNKKNNNKTILVYTKKVSSALHNYSLLKLNLS